MTFSRLWLTLFAGGAVPFLLGGLWPGFFALGFVWDTLLVLAALADRATLPAPNALEIGREVEERLTHSEPNPVRLRVRSLTNRPLRLELRDTPPPELPSDLPEPDPLRFEIAPGARQTATYQITPLLRGDFHFGDLYARVSGRFGLVRRTFVVSARQKVKVYPSLREAAKFTLMAKKGRLQSVGVRQARMQGAGREFESLRDYQPDDELRRVDWKATARQGRLIARQYEAERAQNVILAIDLGRTMLAEVGGRAKLEYALDAALTLAYVASLSDDNVGLLAFSDTVHTWLPPRKGRAQVYAILESLYNARAALVEPDWAGALAHMKVRWPRRSLVVCFTDLWDPESSRQTVTEMAALQPRHLVAAVTLLDTNVLNAARRPVETEPDLFEKAVAVQFLGERERATASLRDRGVLVVDSPAERLSAELVNRYLEVKERMML